MSDTPVIRIEPIRRIALVPEILNDPGPIGDAGRKVADAQMTGQEYINKLNNAVSELSAARAHDARAAERAITAGDPIPAPTEPAKRKAVDTIARETKARREIARKAELEFEAAILGDLGIEWERQRLDALFAASDEARGALAAAVEAVNAVDGALHCIKWKEACHREIANGFGLPTTAPPDNAMEFEVGGYPQPFARIAAVIGYALPGEPAKTATPDDPEPVGATVTPT
jgi:hypothetical protein